MLGTDLLYVIIIRLMSSYFPVAYHVLPSHLLVLLVGNNENSINNNNYICKCWEDIDTVTAYNLLTLCGCCVVTKGRICDTK